MERPRTAWTRIAAEGIVIVGSILLALALDAFWEDRKDRVEEAAYLEALLDDLSETHRGLGEANDLYRLAVANADEVLRVVGGEGTEFPDTTAAKIGSVLFIFGVQAVENTYNELLSTGKLSLIRSIDVRRQLASIHAAIGMISTVEELAGVQWGALDLPTITTKLVYSREIAPPMVRDVQPSDPFGDGYDHLIGDREFWNVVALRRELSGYLLQRQEELLPQIDALIKLVSSGSGDAS